MDTPRHTVVVGALVRNREDAILLIRHPKRGWEIPQGRVEEGESLTAAIHREILEETGLQVKLGPLAAVFSKVSPPPAVVFQFLATCRGGIPRTSEESLEVGWYSRREALRLVTHPVNRDRLTSLLAFSGEVLFRSYTTGPYRMLSE